MLRKGGKRDKGALAEKRAKTATILPMKRERWDKNGSFTPAEYKQK